MRPVWIQGVDQRIVLHVATCFRRGSTFVLVQHFFLMRTHIYYSCHSHVTVANVCHMRVVIFQIRVVICASIKQNTETK